MIIILHLKKKKDLKKRTIYFFHAKPSVFYFHKAVVYLIETLCLSIIQIFKKWSRLSR